MPLLSLLGKSSSVLVTGAAGFIGSKIIESLIDTDFEIVAVDGLLDTTYSREIKLSNWNRLKSLYAGKATFITGDLRNQEFVKGLPPSEYVINEAAFPGLMMSWSHLQSYLDCNIIVVNNLIEYAKENNVKNFVQASTSSVYGRYATGSESSPTSPVSPYGVSKLAAEHLIRANHANFEFPHTILRYFSVYGPGQRPDMMYSIVCDSILNGREIRVTGDGTQTRTNTYVEDIARVTIQSLLEPCMRNETFNISGTREISLLEAIEIIEQTLNSKVKLNFSENRPGDQMATKGKIDKIQDLGILVNTVSVEEGLRKQAFQALENMKMRKMVEE